ncbi:hypothetical protein Lal_00021237 [Lupinus albus]|nr:hypothetical protein Lal_00021237 [Lupinus albus]
MLGHAREYIVNTEEVKLINMGTEEDKKELQMVNNLERVEMINLFREYMDAFDWSNKDMSGLDLNITSNNIPLYLGVEPKKQKVKMMRPNMSLNVKEDVTKQLESGFIEISRHAKWVVNVVMVELDFVTKHLALSHKSAGCC